MIKKRTKTPHAKRGRPAKGAKATQENTTTEEVPVATIIIKPRNYALELLHWALLAFSVLCVVYAIIPLAIGGVVAWAMLWVYSKVYDFLSSYRITKVKKG